VARTLAVTSTPRLHSLDSLRAAMMLLGICLHSAMTYMTVSVAVWPFRDRSQSPICDLLTLFIHAFRMPLFFVLAGFFAAMVHDRAGRTGFLRQRAKRILLPLVVAWLVVFAPTNAGMVYGINAYGPDPWNVVEAYFRSGEFLKPLRTLHLWFLYYLLYFYVIATALATVVPYVVGSAARARFEKLFRSVAGSPLRPLPLAALTCATLYFMNSGALETSGTLLVPPASLIAYSVFFGFGWFLLGHADLIVGFRRYAWTQVWVAMALLPVNAKYTMETMHALPRYDVGAHALAITTGSLIVWLLIFGCIGLAIRYFSADNKRLRYLADASYWMYLVHLPVVVWLQVALVPWQAPGFVKFAVVTAATTAITLWSYQLLVRHSFVATVLNGSRPASGLIQTSPRP